MRNTNSMAMPVASPQAKVASDHRAVATASTVRGAKRCATQPAAGWAIA